MFMHEEDHKYCRKYLIRIADAELRREHRRLHRERRDGESS